MENPSNFESPQLISTLFFNMILAQDHLVREMYVYCFGPMQQMLNISSICIHNNNIVLLMPPDFYRVSFSNLISFTKAAATTVSCEVSLNCDWRRCRQWRRKWEQVQIKVKRNHQVFAHYSFWVPTPSLRRPLPNSTTPFESISHFIIMCRARFKCKTFACTSRT